MYGIKQQSKSSSRPLAISYGISAIQAKARLDVLRMSGGGLLSSLLYCAGVYFGLHSAPSAGQGGSQLFHEFEGLVCRTKRWLLRLSTSFSRWGPAHLPGLPGHCRETAQAFATKSILPRLPVASWYVYKPQSYEMVAPFKPMYILCSYMEP